MAAETVVKKYFDALARRDVEAMAALWAPDGTDRIAGQVEAAGPDGVRAYFTELFAAFPDFALTVRSTVAEEDRVAVHWTATGTMTGPLWGLDPIGARVELEGIDLLRVEGDRLVRNDAVADGMSVARQIGLLPPAGSATEQRLFTAFNARTRAARRAAAKRELERIADGVWLLRGGFPRDMNVYVIEDEGGGVTLFDAGIRTMTHAIATAAAPLGGINRVVLGHADPDHRGAAPALDAPVHCHELERAAAESPLPMRPYFDLHKLRPYARPFYAKALPIWDGGAVQIAGTVAEGDEVAGFRVVELPGHAPGLIGLLRESDRLALCSDTVYTLDIQTGRKGGPRIPHPAFDQSTERASESIRKLAALEPAVVWAGHADPVTGDVVGKLHAAAAAAV
jgi:steroid delta-isomerase-like uncharacterized protein